MYIGTVFCFGGCVCIFTQKLNIMASNQISLKPTVIEGISTVPVSIKATGTFLTQGTGVVGTGTKFLTEMPRGSYIWDTGGEIRYVVRVDSDVLAWIATPFSNDLSEGIQYIIPARICKVKQYVFTAIGGTAQMVDDTGNFNDSFLDSVPFYISKLGNDRSSKRDLLPPTIVQLGVASRLNVQIDY